MTHVNLVPGTDAPEIPLDPSGASSVLSPRYRALTLGCVSVILLIAFEAMAVGTAMPAAAEQLDGVALYAFAFSAFFTTSLLGMVVAGQWSDRKGPTGPVVAGIATFSAGLLLSGTAQSMLMFVVGRAGQGIGGGLVIVALYVTVRRAYPEHLRPTALAALSAAWVVPAMLGPVIAGTVTEHFGWRWVFLGITVLVILPLAVMLPALRRAAGGPPEDVPSGRFDGRRLWLAVAVAAGAGLLQFGGQELRWLSAVPVAAGLALLAPAAVRLLPRGTFRAARGLPSVIMLRGLVSAAFLSTQSFLPLMLVTQRGLSYTQAGLTLAAAGGAWALGSFVQSRPRLEPHRYRLVRAGTGLVAAGVALTPLVLIDAVPVWTPAVTLTFGCFGMGLVVTSMGVLVLRLSGPGKAGDNVASLQVCDSLSNVVMLTVVGTAFAALGGGAAQAAAHTAAADLDGVGPSAFVVVYAAATAVALLAVLVGGRLRTPAPAPGPGRREVDVPVVPG
ncbi:MFS transporter [Streptomyces sp. ACA25]|uniref:MFS transporter n=1 Tax=Streptomyces sp. ACA25 TaxID=3022596 RepID=UPI0023076976|nr:MFS transporter [Streptomyces sp. ACA25]MDB1089498.1 MFS transporter [Streptomyces sp. ACA25]